ncbi:MAG: PIN domain-containing protein [Nanoarchaeota archaeon]
MKIVIDCNRVIASLIKDSTTREILFSNLFEFYSPDFLREELFKYKEEITEKAKLNENSFEILINLFFEHIKIIPEQEYSNFLETFNNSNLDPKDIPYLAVALFTNSKGIWTHDSHFLNQNKVKILTNIDMLNIIRQNSDN